MGLTWEFDESAQDVNMWPYASAMLDESSQVKLDIHRDFIPTMDPVGVSFLDPRYRFAFPHGRRRPSLS